MSTSWSWYVIVIVAINIIGCAWLLFANAKSTPGDTTGHVWDGNLSEYNNPLPMWWVGLYVLTIIFGIGYLALYPGLGANAGMLGWTSAKEHDADVAETNKQLEALFAQFKGKSVADLAHDPKALVVGQNVFANNCVPCHGSAAKGVRGAGYPNLTDTDWLYGGAPDDVVKSITDGRNGAMPPWGPVLGDAGVEAAANYVLQLSGQKYDAAKAAAGKEKYDQFCVACHGPDGKGNQQIGAPDLVHHDSVDSWIYGGDLATIETTIRGGRTGKMPTWGPTLGPDRLRLVAAGVLSQQGQGKQDK
jgi:cytochrome c oxidase cbb3-type subunit 3